MTPVQVGGARSLERTDAAPILQAEGWASVARWALGGLEILGVGLFVPIAILIVGTPIVLAVRLVIEIARLL
jgi:hypothetical protein